MASYRYYRYVAAELSGRLRRPGHESAQCDIGNDFRRDENQQFCTPALPRRPLEQIADIGKISQPGSFGLKDCVLFPEHTAVTPELFF